MESIHLTTDKNIVLSMNTDGIYTYPSCGYNDLNNQFYVKDAVKSFTGSVVRSNIVPEIKLLGRKNLGDVLKFDKSGFTFWGIVCYELNDMHRKETPISIENCLNKIAKETTKTLSYLLEQRILHQNQSTSKIILESIAKANSKVNVYV